MVRTKNSCATTALRIRNSLFSLRKTTVSLYHRLMHRRVHLFWDFQPTQIFTALCKRLKSTTGQKLWMCISQRNIPRPKYKSTTKTRSSVYVIMLIVLQFRIKLLIYGCNSSPQSNTVLTPCFRNATYIGRGKGKGVHVHPEGSGGIAPLIPSSALEAR